MRTIGMPTSLIFINVAHFLDHYFLLIFPTAVLAIHPAWEMSYAEALALGTPAFAAFALATPVSGWLGDRWGGEKMMAVFFIGIALSSIATAFAPGPLSLAAGLACIGVFASIYHPVGTALIVRHAVKTGRALGVNGVWGNMGVAAAALATGALTAWLGWRAAFLVPGVVTLVVGLGYLATGLGSRATGGAGRGSTFVHASRMDQIRVLAVVAVASLMGGLAFQGVTIAMPKLFEERLSSDVGLAGIGAWVSLVFALAAFTQIPVGRLLDRIGAKPIMFTLTGLQAVLLAVLWQVDGALTVVMAVPLMIAMFGEVPVSAWLIGHYVAANWRSRAYSIQFLLALGVSSGVVPLIAWLHGRTGSSDALFLAMACAMSAVFAASWFLPGWRRSRPQAMPSAAPAQ
ncbi:MFS transporter [Tepidamorphus gemmatus]|uniref:MFS transporter n=2 Tax=Tepidamorphus gemmatus TaxID=747076 RepID=A0A4R3MID8_9HYPH|nr:MFS transporter [Tepidamorphus gemmatus]